MELKNKNLGLLMTRGMSLSKWDKIGNLDREIRPYLELSKIFKKIFIFTYGTRVDLKYQNLLPANIEIICRPKYIPTNLYFFLMPFVWANKFRQTDIIKTNQMDGSWTGVIAKKLFHKKLIVRCGYEWLNYLQNNKASFYKRWIADLVEGFSYKNADKIIITSNEDKSFIENRFKINPTKIIVVRNYIDTNQFKPDKNIVKDAKRIIFVGRLHKDKNLFLLLESLKDVDCRLIIIGSGPQEKEIINKANKLNIDIEMLGKVSQKDLPTELQKSSIFVLVSKSEGNPKALLEAMSCGLACIGADVKGIKEVINDNEDGLLTELSMESLKNKIKILLENVDLRDKLGSSAEAKILRDYSLSAILSKEIDIYQNL
jgi:glycosyltransferase involved in cell wall biosynthesis